MAATTWLGACGTDGSSPPVVCPPVVDYDAQTRERAAAAVEALPADSPILTLLEDYGVLRAQARACARAS